MKKIIVSTLVILLLSTLAFGAQEDGLDLISLDLKGMDIRDVLKILSQKSGLNIVADNTVKGTITLYIKDVSVMDALNIIVSTNNLAYEESGSLIRIMNDRDYEMIYGKRFNDRTKTEIIKLKYANAQEIGNAVNQIKTNIGKIISDNVSNTIVLIDSPENIDKMKKLISQMDIPLSTEVFSLDYAKAESLKDKIGEIVSKDVGSIKFDERTNKIVVKDTQQKIEDIRKVVSAFDETTKQVVIDANIVQVTLSDKYSYGIDWMDIAKIGDLKLTGDTNLSTGLSNVTPSTLSIATTGGNYSAIVSLLKTYGKTNVLSRPRITVVDGQEAKILVGAKEVYVTSEVTTTSGGTYHTTDHVQFVDVGVRLAVTPEINKAGFVTLKIKPEVSNADATKTVQLKNPDGSTRTIVPYVTTAEAETFVVVKDGATIIIGGLMKDTLIDHKERVPFLGDIPLIGRLFSAKGKSKEKTELVIFLTPHIIAGDKTTEEAQKYIAEWDKKAEEVKIEEPKEPEIKLSEIMPEKKERSKAKAVSRKVIAEEDKELRQKQVPRTESSVTNRTPYEEYSLEIEQEINDLAKQDKDIRGIRGDVELQFTLDNEGFLIKGPVLLNKPDLRLVRSAVKIVKKASPFLRFPKGLNKEQEDFNIVIRYE
jgi:MSHA type pilus biogenesis protein MshL